MSSMNRWVSAGIIACIAVAGGLLLYDPGSREVVARSGDSGIAEANAKQSPQASSSNVVDANPEQPRDFRATAEAASKWTIRPNNRFGSVEATQLAASPEEWVHTLPVQDQATARAFLERYGDAYEFASKAELAWLIEAGFPAIEEVVAFRRSPETTRECVSPGQRCGSSKVAVLVADEAFEVLQSYAPESVERDAVQARARMVGALAAVAGRESTLFALRVRAESAALRGVEYEASLALDLARACGDYRLGDRGNSTSIALSLRMIQRSDAATGLCGVLVTVRPE